MNKIKDYHTKLMASQKLTQALINHIDNLSDAGEINLIDSPLPINHPDREYSFLDYYKKLCSLDTALEDLDIVGDGLDLYDPLPTPEDITRSVSKGLARSNADYKRGYNEIKGS